MPSSPPRRDADPPRLLPHWPCSRGLSRKSHAPPRDVPRQAPRTRRLPLWRSCHRRMRRWHERAPLWRARRQGRATGPDCNPGPLWRNCALSRHSPHPPAAATRRSECAPGAFHSWLCCHSGRSSGRHQRPGRRLRPDPRQAPFPRHPTVLQAPAGCAARPYRAVARPRSNVLARARYPPRHELQPLRRRASWHRRTRVLPTPPRRASRGTPTGS